MVDVSLYVMTPEFGAACQLEKIDMLDFADFVAINKFDRKGAEDALRDVRKQYQRNRERFGRADRRDAGVRHHGGALQRRRRHRALPGACCRASPSAGLKLEPGRLPRGRGQAVLGQRAIVPADARALSGRDRRRAARLSRARRRAGAHGARAPVAEHRQGACFAGCGKNDRRLRRADRLEGRPARRRTPRSCSTCGRRPCRRPMPATNTW